MPKTPTTELTIQRPILEKRLLEELKTYLKTDAVTIEDGKVVVDLPLDDDMQRGLQAVVNAHDHEHTLDVTATGDLNRRALHERLQAVTGKVTGISTGGDLGAGVVRVNLSDELTNKEEADLIAAVEAHDPTVPSAREAAAAAKQAQRAALEDDLPAFDSNPDDWTDRQLRATLKWLLAERWNYD